jgi:peptidoglycan/xylan/chitin deacetylase (PgdA/CDA1 family)
VSKSGPWRAAFRTLQHGRGACILLYHRVTKLQRDPQWLAVSPENFEQHLAIIAQESEPMALRDFFAAKKTGRIPKRALVVTFDDGYRDNFREAMPLLEKAKVPATFFITSGQIGSDREFWWDELDRLLLSAETPLKLELDVSGKSPSWDFSAKPFVEEPGWSLWKGTDPSPRHAAYRELCALLKPLPPAEIDRVLDLLAQWRGVARAGRHTHQAMSAEELRSLAGRALAEIGAHTVSHPMLSAQPFADQEREIRQSREALEKLIGRVPQSFCYPFGTRADFSEETAKAARDAGFELACANFPKLARQRADDFALPRFLAHNWSGPGFKARLLKFFQT